jgi:hypothetical protein
VTVSCGAPSLKPAGHDRSPIYFIAPSSTRSLPFRPVWFTNTFTYRAELVVPQRSPSPWARTPWWVIEGTAAVNFRKSLLSARRATVFFMLPTSEQIRALATRCEQFRDAKAPGGYPNSLALCIVDSVQSTGIRYGTTAKVVRQISSDFVTSSTAGIHRSTGQPALLHVR